MLFEDANKYKLTNGKKVKFLFRDDFILFLHLLNLSYRYIPKSYNAGNLELFNDNVDLVFDVVLYA